ncbi:hypothetical protein A7326_19635 [Stenotrophomonas maltophilia]|nr:hypothetical protein A7326_19635 [Stenotrophomonas maltophilia]
MVTVKNGFAKPTGLKDPDVVPQAVQPPEILLVVWQVRVETNPVRSLQRFKMLVFAQWCFPQRPSKLRMDVGNQFDVSRALPRCESCTRQIVVHLEPIIIGANIQKRRLSDAMQCKVAYILVAGHACYQIACWSARNETLGMKGHAFALAFCATEIIYL